MYDCICTPGDNTPPCSAGGHDATTTATEEDNKTNVSLLELASVDGQTDWNWPLWTDGQIGTGLCGRTDRLELASVDGLTDWNWTLWTD